MPLQRSLFPLRLDEGSEIDSLPLIFTQRVSVMECWYTRVASFIDIMIWIRRIVVKSSNIKQMFVVSRSFYFHSISTEKYLLMTHIPLLMGHYTLWWRQSNSDWVYNGSLWELNIWNGFVKLRPFLYKMILWKNISQRRDPNYILIFYTTSGDGLVFPTGSKQLPHVFVPFSTFCLKKNCLNFEKSFQIFISHRPPL